MSVATPTARSALRSTSTTSRAEPRSISASAHAWPTPPTPTTPTFCSMAKTLTASAGPSIRAADRARPVQEVGLDAADQVGCVARDCAVRDRGNARGSETRRQRARRTVLTRTVDWCTSERREGTLARRHVVLEVAGELVPVDAAVRLRASVRVVVI